MFKKTMAFLMLLVLTVTLVACGGETEMTNQEKLLEIKNNVTFTETTISSDLDLTLENIDEAVTVTWSSSRTEIISDAGVVTKPSFEAGDTKVFMTLTLTLGEDSVTKIFEFIVSSEEQAIEITTVDAIFDGISFPDTEITENVTMPSITDANVIVEWVSTSGALLIDGTVTRPHYSENDADVTLQLTLTYGDYTRSETYDFTVLKEVKPSFIELTTEYTDALTWTSHMKIRILLQMDTVKLSWFDV
jgi:hypothetical protein